MDNSKVLSFASATGKIEYNMTNNYMFRYILQERAKRLAEEALEKERKEKEDALREKDEEIERLHALLAEHGIAK